MCPAEGHTIRKGHDVQALIAKYDAAIFQGEDGGYGQQGGDCGDHFFVTGAAGRTCRSQRWTTPSRSCWCACAPPGID